MSAYLGTPGRLVPIYSTPTMAVTGGVPARTFETTLEGRVKAQIQRVGRRVWELSATGADPAELGALQAFAGGEWGIGPFVWVAPTAPVTNLLTPAQSTCDPSTVNSGVVAAGPMSLGADGWAGRSFINPDPSNGFYFGTTQAPVLPGTKVTGSAYVVGAGAQVRLWWADAAGAFISTSTSAAAGVAGSATRVSITATAPANAAGACVVAVNTTQGSRPALTWTDTLLEWGTGEGCPKAVVAEVGRTARSASADINGWRGSDVTFRITEVG